MRRRWTLAFVPLLLAPAVRAGYVERRGAEPMLVGRIAASDLSDAGVSVHAQSGAVHFVPWDRVRRVVMDAEHPQLSERLELAEELWRARTRVERSDFTLAEPLLERLFERYRGRTHETALLVAEGLARCRLARGANASAVIPVLEVTRLCRAGVESPSYAMLRPILDEEMMLCPQLPPAWVQSRDLDRLERDLAAYDADADAVVAAIVRSYRRAVAQHLGHPTLLTDEDEAAVGHEGAEFIDLLVSCDAADPERRRAARGRLENDLDGMAPWAEGWARFALGTSALHEMGAGRRERGLVSMLHVPARFARTQPYLAGLALAWVAAEREAAGDAGTAAIVRGDLARRFPRHPARTLDRPVRLPSPVAPPVDDARKRTP